MGLREKVQNTEKSTVSRSMSSKARKKFYEKQTWIISMINDKTSDFLKYQKNNV